jgi:exodeoxyribonuclease V beta subunit
VNRATILDARRSLDLDLSGVSLIEASAGTGKTYTIANLYLRHILAGRQASEILVVSFTNAATDELHQRIHARLYQALKSLQSRETCGDEFLDLLVQRHQALDPEQQLQQERLIQYALRSMDEAMISTIHGFCHAALQDHALLSNRIFESEIISNDDDYWESALKDWWRRNTYPLNSRTWDLLNQAVPGLQKLLQWHRQLRQHRHDRLVPEIAPGLAQLLEDFSDIDTEDERFQSVIRKLKARALDEAHRYASKRVAELKQSQGRLGYQDQLDLLLSALRHKSGAHLAQRLRARFPVAMIDEFQDTDNVQFDIFRMLYFEQPDISLTLIGDPKQAIYSFRGGDIFTYIAARSIPGIGIHALQTNWRSQSGLVNAVNAIFTRRAQAFVYSDAIEFTPAQAAAINDSAKLSFKRQNAKSMTLWQLPLQPNGKTQTMAITRQQVNQAVVAEIVALLDPGNEASIEGRPLQSGDIAILVRENAEGEELRACLSAAGIGSVSIGHDKVFASDEAQGLYLLLEGIAHPLDSRCQRRARACSLFNLDYLALATDIDDDDCWQHWVDRLQSLHRCWINSGFIAMFQQMFELLDLGTALAQQQQAERRLTNLAQLGELLQQQSRFSPGIDALMSWLRLQMTGESAEEAELRLESDAELVKIVTVHKSKGLEYPVVFVPFLWRCKLISKKAALLRFHDDENRAYIDLGSDDFEQHAYLAEKERLAEDLRLLYVALTRARSKVYLVWGNAGDGRSKGQPMHSALGWLLHSEQTAGDLDSSLPMAFRDSAVMLEQLETFSRSCSDIELTALPMVDEIASSPPTKTPGEALKARLFSREMGPAWRINSFSGLTRDVHQVAVEGERVSQGDAILDFPAGSHIGLLMHELLEHLDFQRDIESQGARLIAQRAPAYGVNGIDQQQTLAHWLQLIVSTELDQTGLRLDGLARQNRLNELKFDFALDHFDVDALNALLQQDVAQPLQPIGATRFRGLMTGVIDLVFEYQGKYYLADYKSNFLGARLDDYRPHHLARAMLDRRYDLQALLYSIALHRYLQQRLLDYSYEQHFGGCYYLFLRAMRPQSGPLGGVHFERADAAKLDALERLLMFTPGGSLAI